MAIDDAIKQRLGIKYKCAKQLAEEARAALGSEATEDEIIEEACEIFEDMEEDEQEEMRVPATTEEPEWKRKAKEQAEKREQEWAKEEEQKRLRAEAEARGELDEPEGPGYGVTTTTTTTRTISKTSKIVKVKPEGPATQVGATVSCCVVM